VRASADGANRSSPSAGAAVGERGDSVQAKLAGGVVLTFTPVRVENGEWVVRHDVLGEWRFPLEAIDELRIGGSAGTRSKAQQPPEFAEWTLVPAPEPLIPGASEPFGTYSELVGTPAEDFTLPLLGGGSFRLAEHRGKVVVLDFWATWCGPCVQAMPQLMAATRAFAEDVVFVAVNQGENADIIRTFLAARDWGLAVALDPDGSVARSYQVSAIPQTVVIGRDGTIEHVHLGASADLEASLTTVLGLATSRR
jgi:thiol-disulfide isomerase/thioredoxin